MKDMPSSAGTRLAEWLLGGAALGLVFVLGLLALDYPFVADHVVVLLGAKKLAAGGVLYVDFWDNKMPGLFWLYQLAGHWFGFDENGVHALDLVWTMAFSLLLVVALRGYCAWPWMAGLFAVAVGGIYYASAEAFHLAQIEILVGLPLFVAAWFASRLDWRGPRLAAAFLVVGLMGGVVASFKLILAPLVGVLWLTAAMHAWWQQRLPARVVLTHLALPSATGLATVLAAVAWLFWRQGALDELLWTAFEYPRMALDSAPRAPWTRLLASGGFFFAFYASWGFFMVLAVADWVHRERHVLTSLMVAWLCAALAVILVQRFSWWSYHLQLLFVPAGVLGVRGLGVIPRVLQERGAIDGAVARILVVALAVPPVGALAIPAEQKVSVVYETIVRQHGSRRDLPFKLSSLYPRIDHSVRFLARDTARPGPIYVFGDPLYYHLSGRAPAAPVPGFAWQFFPQSLWEALPGQLDAALPPYIFVDKLHGKTMKKRGGGVHEFLRRDYVPFASDDLGTWYQIRPDLWKARHGAAPAP